jgi:hypothetical protein
MAHSGCSSQYVAKVMEPAATNPSRPDLRSASSSLTDLRLKLAERSAHTLVQGVEYP